MVALVRDAKKDYRTDYKTAVRYGPWGHILSFTLLSHPFLLSSLKRKKPQGNKRKG